MVSASAPPPPFGRSTSPSAARTGRTRLVLHVADSCRPILPVAEGDGEGDRPKGGGGACRASRTPTAHVIQTTAGALRADGLDVSRARRRHRPRGDDAARRVR